MRIMKIALIVLLVLASLLSTIKIVKSTELTKNVYITESSGQNLTNYPVKVVLDADNFEFLTSDGTDIYFTDEANNPLKYYKLEYDQANQYAIFYVQVNLTASSTTTIILHYNGTNPYPDYNDPSILYFVDNFNDGVIGSEWVVLDSTLSEANGILSGTSDNVTDPDGVYVNVTISPSELYVKVEMKGRTQDISARNNQFGVYLYFNDINNFVFTRVIDNDGASAYIVDLYKRVAGTFTALDSITESTSFGSGWYEFEVFNYLNGTIKSIITGEGRYYELRGTQSDFTSGYYGLVIGSDDPNEVFEFDYFVVRKAVDPEPSVYVGYIPQEYFVEFNEGMNNTLNYFINANMWPFNERMNDTLSYELNNNTYGQITQSRSTVKVSVNNELVYDSEPPSPPSASGRYGIIPSGSGQAIAITNITIMYMIAFIMLGLALLMFGVYGLFMIPAILIMLALNNIVPMWLAILGAVLVGFYIYSRVT